MGKLPAATSIQRPVVPVVDRLLASDEPAIRLRTIVDVCDAADSAEAERARAAIPACARVRRLLSERRADGTIPFHPYRAKWYGAHWVLVTLAELGYPPGDPSLTPLREQVLGWLLSEEYETRLLGRVRGLPRMHASIDGNAVWALLRLGLADERVEQLVRRILRAQWPDGGWNCDRRASGRASSFTESLIPLRALALHQHVTGDGESHAAAVRASELFLTRRLYRRLSDGSAIRPSFLQLHFPCYWHYDILFALTVMAEAGRIGDPRCNAALALLERKRLADGGFPAEARFHRVTDKPDASGRSLVAWGPTSARRSNDWVTLAALAVQAAAGDTSAGRRSVAGQHAPAPGSA